MTTNNTEKSIGYSIGKTNWYLKTLLNKYLREEGCGITNEQWIVLKVIDASPALSQTEISVQCQKDKTNITRILDLLEKKGCIERRKDDRDRRMYRIYITGEGQNVLKTVSPVIEKAEEICIQSLSKSQVKGIIDSLEALCESIKKEL